MSSQSVPGFDIVLGARTDKLRAELAAGNAAVRETAAEMRATGRAAGESLGRDVRTASASAGAALKSMTEQVGGVGPALKGAQQATAATTQALSLLGQKGSPAVTGLSNAVAGLLSGGFTPLGIAIAGITASLALFTSAQSTATAASDAMALSVATQADEFRDLVDAAESAALRSRAKTSGTSVELQAIEEEIAAKQRQIDMNNRAARQEADADPYFARGTSRWTEITRETIALEKQLQVLANKRALIQQTVDAEATPRTSITADTEYQRKRNAEVAALLAEQRRAAAAAKVTASDEAVSPAVAMARGEVVQLEAAIEKQRTALRVLRGEGSENEVALQQAMERYGSARLAGASEDELVALAKVVTLKREILELEKASAAAAAENAAQAEAKAARAARDAAYADEFFASQARDAAARDEAVYGEAVPTAPQRQVRDASRLMISDMRDVESQAVELQQQFATSWGAGIANSFMQAQRGAESFGQSFLRVTENVLQSIEQMLLQKALVSAVSSAMGFASPEGGVFATPRAPMPMQDGGARALGGSYMVGGTGGVDSQLVAFRATPGERFDVTPPGKAAAGGGGTDVTVINYTGAPAKTERSRGSNGREQIRVLVGQAMAEDFATNGPGAQALQRRYDLRPQPVRRGG